MPPARYETAILIVKVSLICIFCQVKLMGHLLHLANPSQSTYVTLSKNP